MLRRFPSPEVGQAASKPPTDDAEDERGPVRYMTNADGLVMGCSTCRYSWFGCHMCKQKSFKGKRRNQVTWAQIDGCKQQLNKNKTLPTPAKGKPGKAGKVANAKKKAAPKAKQISRRQAPVPEPDVIDDDAEGAESEEEDDDDACCED